MDWSFVGRDTVSNNIRVIADQEIETIVMEGEGNAESRLTTIQGIMRLVRAIEADIDDKGDA